MVVAFKIFFHMNWLMTLIFFKCIVLLCLLFQFLKNIFDLSNEGNLFSAMSFSISSLIGFSKYEYDAFCLYVFELPILSWIWSYVGLINDILEDMILCFWFVLFVLIQNKYNILIVLYHKNTNFIYYSTLCLLRKFKWR